MPPVEGDVQGLVFNVQHYSLHDGPGIRTTVFLKGCPLRCLWCHNPESMRRGPQLWFEPTRCINCGECVPVCPRGAHRMDSGVQRWEPALCEGCGRCAEVCYAGASELVGRPMSVAEALVAVEADRSFYERSGGGVTLSGGEPVLQPDFATAFLSACRSRGLHTALDTSGYAAWASLQRVAAHADLVLFDVKHTDPQRHRALTGVSNARILSNLRRLLATGARVAIRLPVIPGANDEDDHFRTLAAFLRACPAPPVVADLLPYHGMGEAKHRRLGQPYTLSGSRAPDAARLEAIRDILAESGVPVHLPD